MSIWTLIELRLSESSDANPHVVARRISAQLDERSKARYFDELLPTACVTHNSRLRRGANTAVADDPNPDKQPAPRSSKVSAVGPSDG